MQIIIETTAAQVQAKLAKVAAAIADTQPMLQGIGQALATNIDARFDTRTDPAGHAWEPYKAVSAAIHEAIHGKPPQGTLLDRSGIMRGGVEHHVLGDVVEVGLTAPYAAFHEFGTEGRKSPHGGGPIRPGTKGIGPIPRRGMVFGAISGVGAAAQVTQALSAGDEADVIDVIERHILQATSGLG